MGVEGILAVAVKQVAHGAIVHALETARGGGGGATRGKTGDATRMISNRNGQRFLVALQRARKMDVIETARKGDSIGAISGQSSRARFSQPVRMDLSSATPHSMKSWASKCERLELGEPHAWIRAR